MLLITRLLLFILFNTTQITNYEVWQIDKVFACNKFSACNSFGDCYDFKLIGIKCIEADSAIDNFYANQTVYLEYDIEKEDEYNNRLVYAYTHENKQINKELIRQGFASIHTVIPNIKYAHHYYDLQKSMKQKE